MRIVVDTNTALSGLLWQATPRRLINAVLAAGVDAIVSGDKDLLTLGNHGGIPILNAAVFLSRHLHGHGR